MSNDADQAQSVPSTYERLAARFEPSEHKTKTISGNALTYVDGETVVSRLNQVLGFDGWSFETIQINVLEKEVWATGRLTVYVGDRKIVREQAGGQIINRTRAGEIIELSNDIKGALTDCLKKCATLVGVGLYLYDPDERAEVKAEMAAAKRAPQQPRGNAPPRSGTQRTPSSGAGDSSTPAPSNDDRAFYSCQDCKEQVTDTTFSNGDCWTVDEIVGRGRRIFGRVLCITCFRKAADAKKQVQADG